MGRGHCHLSATALILCFSLMSTGILRPEKTPRSTNAAFFMFFGHAAAAGSGMMIFSLAACFRSYSSKGGRVTCAYLE
jgi:hypothetical protein